MTAAEQIIHLVRRAFGSWSNSPPSAVDIETAREALTAAEFSLWCEMQGRDKRHSLEVLARFDALMPGATRESRAAALLHDVGKSVSNLGWTMRVVATLVGPRVAGFALYHDHERIGSEMLRGVSDPQTVALVSGSGDESVVRALRAADDI